ncbi:hypothetical protein H311_02359 [Anncaliia algerae PRA109]|uniref:40S ribosomal protein S28 n=1 Tax=Anncaliia algerae PRA339 TaxID=1288291 RepID=A0A059EYY7_9MICR|nr:hypothetical protein H311_02359 [Anncaliia algerae PRA109]KCZ80042.1 hypothetical protein H312_02560 [Anncaliia algerae PRA339]
MAEENTEYEGKVVKLFNKTGSGGAITICQLELLHTGRHIQRAIMGPVREGDIIKLLECEREHRRGRF